MPFFLYLYGEDPRNFCVVVEDWYLKFLEEIDERIAIRDGGKSHNSAQYGILVHPSFHLFDELIFRVHHCEDVGFADPAFFSMVREDSCELVVIEMKRDLMLFCDCFQLFAEEIQPIINTRVVVFRLGVTDEESRFLRSEDGDGASMAVHNRAFSPPVAFSSNFSQSVFLVFAAFEDEASAGGMRAGSMEEGAEDSEAIGACAEGDFRFVLCTIDWEFLSLWDVGGIRDYEEWIFEFCDRFEEISLEE